MNEPIYELYAIKYASNGRRSTRDAFLSQHDIHEGPLALDFFIWAAVHKDRVILIDSGSEASTCKMRGHDFLRCPSAGLQALGYSPRAVTDVVVTHMHWDHVGNFDKFPNARFHIHPKEMAHATGPCMCHPHMRRPYDVEQVCAMIRGLYGGRVEFSQNSKTIAPGLTVHHVGGHTPGLQAVRVRTARGEVVLASDAMHYYENAARNNPFPVLVDMGMYLDAHKEIARLADSHDHIIPGHDPLIMEQYPAVNEDTRGLAVRLDVAPLFSSSLANL